jgi:rhodanese-related sulfurtransferase
VPDLTAPEVRQLVEEEGALPVHVLSRIEFDMQHLPGSINIPVTEVAASDALPADRERPLVFYCMGVR